MYLTAFPHILYKNDKHFKEKINAMLPGDIPTGTCCSDGSEVENQAQTRSWDLGVGGDREADNIHFQAFSLVSCVNSCGLLENF